MFKLFKSLKVVFLCKQTVVLGVVAVLVCIAAMLFVSRTVPLQAKFRSYWYLGVTLVTTYANWVSA